MTAVTRSQKWNPRTALAETLQPTPWLTFFSVQYLALLRPYDDDDLDLSTDRRTEIWLKFASVLVPTTMDQECGSEVKNGGATPLVPVP